VRTFVHLSLSLAVNAHASPEKQEAAQTAIDFFARPAQNALFARIQGGMTQFEFRTRDLPAFMSTESSAVTSRAYAIEPAQTWPNANVSLAMQNNQTGLITGQRTADDVLKAMDAAWKPGTG
jgi:raffinose/stachyose/melibiose transport system substrate-binding protein